MSGENAVLVVSSHQKFINQVFIFKQSSLLFFHLDSTAVTATCAISFYLGGNLFYILAFFNSNMNVLIGALKFPPLDYSGRALT